jgi:predicted RNA-binding protein YlqC (UPF0109 family)
LSRDTHETAGGEKDAVMELISFLAVNMVEHPDDVTISVTEVEGREIFQVRVHPEDLGKMIGKGGQTARAIRTLLAAVSANSNRRLGLEIIE